MKIANGNSLTPILSGAIAIAVDDVNYAPLIRKDKVTGIDYEISYTKKLIIFLVLSGKNVEINLSEITNQETWTLDQQGINQAMEDINSWL